MLRRLFVTGLAGAALCVTTDSGILAQESRTPARATQALRIFSRSGAPTPPATNAANRAQGQPTQEPGFRPSRRPAPAEAAQVDAIRALGGGGPSGPSGVKAPKPGELQEVILTAQRPWINEQAHVVHTLAYSVDPSSGVVNFNKNYPGATTVYFKGVQDGSYLVDFVVDSWGDGTYRVTSGEVNQDFTNADGAQHLMVGVKTTAAGWVDLRLTRGDGVGYHLTEIKITRVN